mgnify:CR=1 FL=1
MEEGKGVAVKIRPKVTKTSIVQRDEHCNITIGQIRKLTAGLPDNTPFYVTETSSYQASLSDGYKIELELMEMVGVRLRGEEGKTREIEYIPVEEAINNTSGFGCEWEMVGKSFKAVRIGYIEYEWLV